MIIYCQNINVVSEKGSAFNIVYIWCLNFGNKLSKIKKAFGALLTGLSKAFDCLNDNLLIANLHAYGLDLSIVKLLQNF